MTRDNVEPRQSLRGQCLRANRLAKILSSSLKFRIGRLQNQSLSGASAALNELLEHKKLCNIKCFLFIYLLIVL